jgi:outer membrane protein insertion porin family
VLKLPSKRALPTFAVLLVLTAMAVPAIAAAQSTFWGRKVLDIQLKTDASIHLKAVAAEITQGKGKALNPHDVEQSLKNLYASGLFRELKAEAKAEDDGVVLIFVGRARYYVGQVSATVVPHNVRASAVVSAARLRLGQALTQKDIVEARQHILSLLSSSGYHRAKLTSTLALDTEHQIADIVFDVSPGPPTLLGTVRFEGNASVASSRLESAAGLQRAKHIDAAIVDRGIFRIHRFYAKRGRLEAAASVESQAYDAKTNRLNLVIKVDEGPLVKVRVVGIKVSTSALKQALPVYSEGQSDDLSLNTGSRNLQDYLERHGYYSARVKWNRSGTDRSKTESITYTVVPGPRSAFAGYTFEGNHVIPDADLASVLQIQPKSFPGNMRGTFSRQLLAQDVASLTDVYHSRGYLAAKVTPEIKPGPDELWVTFAINEGVQSKVRRLSLTGVATETAKKLCATLPMKPGHPYSPRLAAEDRDAIFTYFSKRGYNQAAATWTVSPESPQHTVDLVYHIKPGKQEFVQSVVVVGRQHVRQGVVLHQLTFKPGQPLDESTLFESQTRLYDLGLFNQVQIAPTAMQGSGDKRMVLVSVDEAHRWTLGYGGGVDVQRLSGNQPQGQFSASPRVSLDLTRIGVGGRNQTFSLSGQVSSLETGASSSYSIPNFLNHPALTLRIDALSDRTRDVLTFTSNLDEASVGLQKRYGSGTYVLARYSYRYITVSDLHISPETIPLISQPARIGEFGATLVRDLRDNPADATRGSFTLLAADVAATALGSQANFWRVLGQNSTYYRLSSHLIFARNTQVGVESSYGTPRRVNAPGLTGGSALTDEIPLPERFFAGGSDSIRAFSLDQAGPRDPETGYPIGGNALFVNSLEFRVPFARGRYGLVLFNDAGNVYSGFSTMRLLKFMQTSPADLDYTVADVGMGLRYTTPVGPVRVDVAYAVNPPRYQITTPTIEIQQLPRFQFFLSFGQSF